MSIDIFSIPPAGGDYNLQDASLMVHDLNAAPATSTKTIPLPLFKEKLKFNIIPFNTLLIFKAFGNSDLENIESGDYIQGFIEGIFVKLGRYNSGDRLLLASYTIFDSLEP